MRIREIAFLADENISPRIVNFLRQLGFDVLDVKEQGWFGKDDEFILDTAFRENRFVLTYDSDFGTLAVNVGKPFFGIVYLRLRDLRINQVIPIIEKFIHVHVELSAQAIVVIEENKVRIRYHVYPE